MPFDYDSNQTFFNRQAELRVWMFRNDITFEAIGRELKVTGHAVAKMLKGERMPSLRYHQIKSCFLIPDNLLPLPLDVPTGPKPKELRV